MQVTANLGFLFTEHPFLERFAAARAAGFRCVECHSPYDHALEEIRSRLDETGLILTGLNTPTGDRAKGEFGLAGLPGRESEFRRGFEQALAYAAALGCRSIHVLAGVAAPDERAAARRTYVANLRWAAKAARGTGLMLLLEPISTQPGYLVTRSDEVAEILKEIADPAVQMLFDIFHVHVLEGDVLGRIQRHGGLIGHVQIAGLPHRNEPDRSVLPLGSLSDALRGIGYTGLIGLEYQPLRRTDEGLAWLSDNALWKS
ncbi:MAG TPA: TIM barrel protein [Microvirga sp.]|jgi:hydroxypyruvate isomerase|nr:TIM barrel protein [Microvirga sp.]